MKRSVLGRLFIKVYYTLSPPLAINLLNATNINKLARCLLDNFVDYIKED